MKKLTNTQVFHLARFSFFETIREIPYWIIIALMVATMVGITYYDTTFYNAKTLPATYFVVDVIRRFEEVILIAALVYYAEDFWRARTLKVHLITDTFPVSDRAQLLGKTLGIIAVYTLSLTVFFLSGILVQTIRGYYDYNITLYVSVFVFEFFARFIIFLLFSTVFHLITKRKFLAIGLSLILIFLGNILTMININQPLLNVGELDLGMYSELAGFSGTYEATIYSMIYWIGLVSALGIVFFRLNIRGSNEDSITIRFKALMDHWNFRRIILLALLLMIVIGTGATISLKHDSSNVIQSKKERQLWMAEYEKKFKRIEFSNQPVIKEIRLDIDLYPKQKRFKAKGVFILENVLDEPIVKLLIQNNPHPAIATTAITFDQETKIDLQYENFHFHQYALINPLKKGDRIVMNFEVVFQNNEFGGLGIAHGMAHHGVISNGTFINESFFPRIGYRSGWEIESNAIREKHGLPPKDRMMSWNDPNATIANSRIFAQMDLNLVVSTTNDQTVVAPGKLIANWQEKDRNYFKFESTTPVEDQFVILSGNYELLTDEFSSDRQKEAVELKIYHNQGHSKNVPSMMKSLKASLKYCETNFSEFQYDQLQIVEFPRYSRFAQSVPNTIPFSEDIGFNMDINEGDADVPYYVTAHEVSHQWWGDQLQGSWVQGVAMLSETLAQYSAAMIYRKEFGMESLEQIIDYERNRYLKGRATEVNGEKALIEVESQAYIHYGKGLTNMLALEAYIGELKINTALSSFLNEWSINKKEGRYPLTEDLIDHFRAVTPDSLQFLISDLFEKIVLNDIRLQRAEWKQTESESGILCLEILASKMSYSDIGEELEAEEIKWIPVGIWDDGFIRYELMPIDSDGTIKVELDRKPQKVEIDPYHFMIERNSKDNSFEF